MISGNPGEQLILFILYISVIGLIGAAVVYLWVKISGYRNNKKAKQAPGTQMENKELLIYRSIDKILWNDWDPIGVNQISDARDEYQTYVPGIYDLKTQHVSIETLAKLLNKIETDRMGLEGDIDKCRAVAQKIIEL